MSMDGSFVWFDLMTTDLEAAKAFYGEVIGWKSQLWDEGDKPYDMIVAGDKPVGGMMTLPDEAAAMGAPPHWMGYVHVSDVDDTVAQTVELGGKVLRDAWDIPNVGRVAILADPQGAPFAVHAPSSPMPEAPQTPKVGHTTWHELNTTDYEGAWSFYSKLFGWLPTESMDMGAEMGGAYFMFRWPSMEGSAGGMSNAAAVMKVPPHWLFYVTVDDTDAACKRVEQHGGKVLNGPMEVPGGDHIAQCMDPQGVIFAIHSVKK